MQSLATDVLLPLAGIAVATFVLPNQAGLAGQVFRLQVVGVELPATSLVQLTNTNALDLTIGAL